MKYSDFTFGSAQWPGIAKLVEESGEVLVEAGNLMANPNDLIVMENLEEELADMIAAAWAVAILNKPISKSAVEKRVKTKLAKHLAKHKERVNGNVCKDRQGQRKPRRHKADHVPSSLLASNTLRADDPSGLQSKRKK